MVLSLFAETWWATLNGHQHMMTSWCGNAFPMKRILFKGFLSQICSFDMKRFLTCLHNSKLSVFTPWPFRPKGYCRCLRPSICPSVRPTVCLSVRRLYLVGTITRHRFELESRNLHQTCIMGYSRLVLKMEVIDLDLQGHFGHFDSEFWEFWLVRPITFNDFELDSLNFHQICILGFSQLVLEMGGIDLDLQGQFNSQNGIQRRPCTLI